MSLHGELCTEVLFEAKSGTVLSFVSGIQLRREMDGNSPVTRWEREGLVQSNDPKPR